MHAADPPLHPKVGWQHYRMCRIVRRLKSMMSRLPPITLFCYAPLHAQTGDHMCERASDDIRVSRLVQHTWRRCMHFALAEAVDRGQDWPLVSLAVQLWIASVALMGSHVGSVPPVQV
jgi:hypothetical protein